MKEVLGNTSAGKADGQVLLDASAHIVDGLLHDAESAAWERQAVDVRRSGVAPAEQGISALPYPRLRAYYFDAPSGLWDGGWLAEEGKCGA